MENKNNKWSCRYFNSHNYINEIRVKATVVHKCSNEIQNNENKNENKFNCFRRRNINKRIILQNDYFIILNTICIRKNTDVIERYLFAIGLNISGVTFS